MIIVEPSFGLANRMRVIASCIRLNSKLNKEVTIAWQQVAELNCPYEDLFMPLPGLNVINKPGFYAWIKATQQSNTLKKVSAAVINSLLGIDYCIKFNPLGNEVHKESEAAIFENVARYKNIYIKTCGEFGEKDDVYQLFRPIEELQQRIDERVSRYSGNTIGLHIRRSDHRDAIANSPLESFFTLIDQEIARSSETTFYLSTDDHTTELQLKQKYGKRIMTYEKDFSRNSSQGIKDALVDLYCLANTRKIYGSFNSSFSDIASRIYGIEIEFATRKSTTSQLV